MIDGVHVDFDQLIHEPPTQTYITNVNNALEKFPELAALGIGEEKPKSCGHATMHALNDLSA